MSSVQPARTVRMQWQSRWAAGDTPWDHGEAAPPLVDWLHRHPAQGAVLLPGCGSGHDVRAVAASGATKVIGLDVAPSAITKAQTFPRAGTESYRVGDFLLLPEEFAGTFDAIVEHTCFCAIDPQDRPCYVASAARALKAGGQLVAVFYLNPQKPGGPPFGVSRTELDRYFDDTFILTHAEVPQRTFSGREGREELRIYRKR